MVSFQVLVEWGTVCAHLQYVYLDISGNDLADIVTFQRGN